MTHPTKTEYIDLLKHIRRTSRRAIGNCKSSIARYEHHLNEIEEAEDALVAMGELTENDRFNC